MNKKKMMAIDLDVHQELTRRKNASETKKGYNTILREALYLFEPDTKEVQTDDSN